MQYCQSDRPNRLDNSVLLVPWLAIACIDWWLVADCWPSLVIGGWLLAFTGGFPRRYSDLSVEFSAVWISGPHRTVSVTKPIIWFIQSPAVFQRSPNTSVRQTQLNLMIGMVHCYMFRIRQFVHNVETTSVLRVLWFKCYEFPNDYSFVIETCSSAECRSSNWVASDVLYCSFTQSLLYGYRERCDVCSEIHTKHVNTLCGQNVEFVNDELAIHQSHPKCFVNYARVMIFIDALQLHKN